MRTGVLQMLAIGLAGLGSLLLGNVPGHAAAADQVDLELVLAVDVSQSMDYEEQRVQRDGYVQAFRSPEVIDAITDGLTGRIAVTYLEWAGSDVQTVVVPWTVIDGKDSGKAFSDRLAAASLQAWRGTSISSALTYSIGLFDASPVKGTRRAIDVSGDGPNNMGIPVLAARSAVLAKGITINGLPIMLRGHSFGDAFTKLDQYYKECVMGGPDAFMFTVDRLDLFPVMIRRKLVQEIAGMPGRQGDDRVVPAQYGGSGICFERPMFFQP